MTRTRVRTRRAVAVALLTLALAPAAGRALGGEGSSAAPAVRHHVVRDGETLWSIARGTVGPEGDPRPVVDRLRDLNAVDPGALRPGSRLLVPAPGA